MASKETRSVRFSPEEWEEVSRRAAAEGVPVGELIRATVLGQPLKRRIPSEDDLRLRGTIRDLIEGSDLIPTNTIGLSAVYEGTDGERRRLPPSQRFIHPGISRCSLYLHGDTIVATGGSLGARLSERIPPTGTVGVTDAKRYPAWKGEEAVAVLASIIEEPLKEPKEAEMTRRRISYSLVPGRTYPMARPLSVWTFEVDSPRTREVAARDKHKVARLCILPVYFVMEYIGPANHVDNHNIHGESYWFKASDGCGPLEEGTRVLVHVNHCDARTDHSVAYHGEWLDGWLEKMREMGHET